MTEHQILHGLLRQTCNKGHLMDYIKVNASRRARIKNKPYSILSLVNDIKREREYKKNKAEFENLDKSQLRDLILNKKER
jgi:uncharacterized protein YjiS (DUF1127 family)